MVGGVVLMMMKFDGWVQAFFTYGFRLWIWVVMG